MRAGIVLQQVARLGMNFHRFVAAGNFHRDGQLDWNRCADVHILLCNFEAVRRHRQMVRILRNVAE